MTAPRSPFSWARSLVRSLVHAGVRRVVLSPGSRSTPLALALLEREQAGQLALHVVIDERSAAFAALGAARVSGEPVALVCTSGTALTHYLPALVEASLVGLSLVVVSADRPLALQGCGSPQTIDQGHVFGRFVRGYFDVGAPLVGAEGALARKVAQAVALARGPTPGPVHLNAPFDKPLEPTPDELSVPLHELDAQAGASLATASSKALPSAEGLRAAAELLRAARRPLVVAGPLPMERGAQRTHALVALARSLGAPVFAEATSQVRFAHAADTEGLVAISHMDALLRVPRVRDALQPDVVLELGLAPTSAAWASFRPGARRVVLTPSGVIDPTNDAALVVQGDDVAALEALGAALGPALGHSLAGEAGFAGWLRALDRVAAECARAQAEGDRLTEAGAALEAVRAAPQGSLLFVGNSLPARELDAWVTAAPLGLSVAHQRGASGIDGLVAGAVGSAWALGGPVTLVLGDVSLAHDAGSLTLLGDVRTPLVVMVVDNDGGRIFDRLPAASVVEPGAMRRLFHTPVHVDREALARAHRVAFERPTSRSELARALARAHERAGATLVEVRVEPTDSLARSRRLVASLERALPNPLPPCC